MSQHSHYRRALAAGLAQEVKMQEAKLVDFSRLPSIGTDGLNSCSVVIVLSINAAILAHIAPLPGMTTDAEAGIRNAGQVMHDVEELYHANRHLFEGQKYSVVVYATYGDITPLYDQVGLMRDRLASMGLYAKPHSYNVPVDRSTVNCGTVFVDTSEGRPVVWIQEEKHEFDMEGK